MDPNKQTSLITLLSSAHGRMRREQRDIDKRDLQKALKYGSREFLHDNNRWKITYDGIIFIVDNNLRREVTCFPAPLATAPVTLEQRERHVKAKDVMKRKPGLCNSHTVLVMDISGSMRERDIPLHRDRQIATGATAKVMQDANIGGGSFKIPRVKKLEVVGGTVSQRAPPPRCAASPALLASHARIAPC